MKKKIFTSFIAGALLSAGSLQAQLILEENFDYDANRPLVSDAIAGSDNFDGVTGWSTQANGEAGTNVFNITEGALKYTGYIASETGNSMTYTGEAGQGVFKLFDKNVRNDSTVYISFLINIPNEEITGGDYFLGLKMEPQANSTNWGGRIFAKVEPDFSGEEVTFGINKMSGGSTKWATEGNFCAAGKTHLIVMKYHVGVLNGSNAEEEAGNYDDVMSLFINPPLDGKEPAEAAITYSDPDQKDIYRYTESGNVFGGARGLYFRSSPTGNAPAYTISGIRAGLTWEEVVPAGQTGIKENPQADFSYYVNRMKQIVLSSTENAYNAYEVVSLTGQKVLSGKLSAPGEKIDASSLPTGVYVLKLTGKQSNAVKIAIK